MKTPSHTIVLVHGLWVTPLSWEPFKRFYENRGHRVLAPAWPGIEGSVEDMRRDPSSFNGVGAGEVVDHYAKIIRALPESPIIMGHSYGGAITQLLIDRGLGAAGVAIDSVPPKGILLLPLSTNLALTPALLNPRTLRGTFLFTFKQWWRVFANTLTESEARAAYHAQAIPAPGRAIFQAALANFTPNATTTVNFQNPTRAPLLFIGGEKDVIMPASLSRKIFSKHRVSPRITAYKEFPGRSHYIIAEQGWEEVADYALAWAIAHPTGGRATQVSTSV
ncbi:MAG TPA: alpha/beta hydrolase [Opitutus sp.]|nr:alpha/beta hydrolase [Opitutus sp.]